MKEEKESMLALNALEGFKLLEKGKLTVFERYWRLRSCILSAWSGIHIEIYWVISFKLGSDVLHLTETKTVEFQIKLFMWRLRKSLHITCVCRLILIENHYTEKKVRDIIELIILLKFYWETWILFYNRCKLLWQNCTLIFYWWLLLLWLDLFYGQLDWNCFLEIYRKISCISQEVVVVEVV